MRQIIKIKADYMNKFKISDNSNVNTLTAYNLNSNNCSSNINKLYNPFSSSNAKRTYNVYNKPFNFKINNDNKTNINNSGFFFKKNIYENKQRNQKLLPPIFYTPDVSKNKVNIQAEIETIDDILSLIEKYPLKWDTEYNINMNALHKIKDPLTKLNNMIGMLSLKNAIVDQILYFIQDFHINNSSNGNDFLHTVIYGPPGTGKTEIAKIIGKVYSKIGILKKNIFKKVTRSDLIAGYLGQTAIKTKNVIEKSLGGVLFIDEAYALGNVEKRDSFAKECIDTLCEALSDYKDNLMVIIAGYEDELNKCFFEYNQGLDSRFTWRFKTNDYTHEELYLIFKKKINEIGWTLNSKITPEWFKNKMEYFKYYGRDMETLLAKIKIAHSKRVFCLDKTYKKNINKKDMNKGFDMFISNDEVKKRKNDDNDFYKQMFC